MVLEALEVFSIKKKGRKLSAKEKNEAIILGWAVETLQASFFGG